MGSSTRRPHPPTRSPHSSTRSPHPPTRRPHSSTRPPPQDLTEMADEQQQQFCLRWNDYQTTMVENFKNLRNDKSFSDVTIVCEGQNTKAHKMLLCACSPYFKNLLESNPAKNPIIFLKDVPFQHMTAILEFMYAGEVNVAQDQLPQFLKSAEKLKVKGLAEAPQNVKMEQ